MMGISITSISPTTKGRVRLSTPNHLTKMDNSFLSLVPKGWIRTYMEAMQEAQNEMPMAFHFLAASVVIGQMIGLEAWATLARGVRIYPNINGLLLSPAGQCRRGEGTKITAKLAALAGVNVLSGKTTPEGLQDELMENGNTLLYVEELSMLLTKQDFQLPIIPMLTKLLLHGDGKVDTRTRGGGKKIIPFVNLSALFTSAPDWFMTTIPAEAFGGGMMSRFLVCCLSDRDVHHIDIQADDQDALGVISKLAKQLADLKGLMTGHIVGTDDAQRWVEPWYLDNESKNIEDGRLAPHRNRKPANLLRLAMILQASRGESVLTKEALENSLAVLDWFEPTLVRLYGITEEITSHLAKGEKRIINKLSSVQGNELLHAELAQNCASYFYHGTREMKACLEGLCEKGLVEPVYLHNRPRKWPPLGWRLKTKDGSI